MNAMTDISTTATRAGTAAARYGSYPDLAGKVAIVTGGSRGIGAATATALAANGALVAVVGRDEAAMAAVTAGITERAGRAIWLAADCTVPADLERMTEIVTDQLGPLDVVASFAGGNGSPVPTAAETPEHWREVIETDLNSVFYTVRAVVPAMTGRGGTIVTMSSAAARQAAKSAAAYAAAKAGVIAFTRHLAGELAPHRIRVNCIAPSATENDKMRAWMSADQRAALGASFPLGRLGQPDDVAAAALFLASDASAWITGATLDVAGGKIML
jgi:3-oxoacyl-[acyl-carrier protein] reductase